MNKGIWITDHKTADYILYVGSTEVARIKKQDIVRMENGELYLGCSTLVELKAQLAEAASK